MINSREPNKLIEEKSPYLLQHAYNPVNWYPWGEEAFKKAKQEDKTIFLSIGYSTCHWCHVMERESFEDQEVADVLNENFISIKVDREERPDIDHIYMTVCQALTGHGGWPLTIIMTSEQKPFYAGTYFPKSGRMGMIGILDILARVITMWNNNKKAVILSSEELFGNMQSYFLTVNNKKENLTEEVIHDTYEWLTTAFEQSYGGFSQAPKFPSPHQLCFLLRYYYMTGEKNSLDMVEKTLQGMYEGGIFDHIGFGFSRYSTDKRWLVPHFEKMLYDNALLAIAYLEVYQVTGKEVYASITRKIFKYILRDMTSPEGGFYSAEDADSEGEEGKFYLWTPSEIIDILGEKDGNMFCQYYDISEKGNFEGQNIPNRIHANTFGMENEVITSLRDKILSYREKRVHPHKDDKILISWNGLMIAAMAIGGRILKDETYTAAAEKAVQFIFNKMIREDGRLLARYRENEANYPAYAEDYANLIWGLIEMYQVTYKPYYLKQAIKMQNQMTAFLWDNDGGFYLYGKDSEQLITRPKELYDGAIPSGNSVAALNLLRLARITGNTAFEQQAEQQLKAFGSIVKQNAASYTFFLIAVMFATQPTKEIVINGERCNRETHEMIQALHSKFLPNTVSVLYSDDLEGGEIANIVPSVKAQKAVDDKTTAYICENFSCQSPVTDMKQFEQMLQ